MPKEADQLEGGGGKESKEERTQDASEETVRKRVRANTPSPHRGNTPQGEEETLTNNIVRKKHYRATVWNRNDSFLLVSVTPVLFCIC